MSNVKFFKQNLINSTCSFSLTSALTSSTIYLFDENDNTKLTSIASSDTASEIWDFTFSGAQTVSAFHMANHNFKQFSLKYWSATAFVDFSTPIATTTNSGTYHYMDNFTAVSTSKIRLQADKTIVADMEKSMGGFRVLNEMGEMSRNPVKANIKYHENAKNYYTDAKESVNVLFGVSTRFDLEWKNLPATDISLLEECKYLGEPFYVYLCGGTYCSTARGWRLEDITLVNYTNPFDPEIADNLLANGENIKVTLEGVKPRST